MEIKVRNTSMYQEVILSEGSTLISLGLLNDAERKALATIFLNAASELLDGLKDEFKCDCKNQMDTVIYCVNCGPGESSNA